jgi:hypothetical protein
MFVAHALVTVVAATADPYAATNAIMGPKWLLATMTKLGVPESWITKSGLLKAGPLSCSSASACHWSRRPLPLA